MTPICASSLSMVATSLSAGTLVSVSGSRVRRAAHSRGKAAFLAPEIAVSPRRATPPSIRSLSIGLGPFLRRQRFHRQRVKLPGVQLSANSPIDTLLALDGRHASKLATHNQG